MKIRVVGLTISGLLGAVLLMLSLRTPPVRVLADEDEETSEVTVNTNASDPGASPVSIALVLRAHNVPKDPELLSSFSAQAVRLTSRPHGDQPDLPSFFERQLSVVWNGEAYRRDTADRPRNREQVDLFDGRMLYRVKTEEGKVLSESAPVADRRFKSLAFVVAAFGLVPVLRQLADPAAEALYLGRTAGEQDKFDVTTPTGRFTLFTDSTHLISRVEARGKVVEYGDYRAVDGVWLAFIQRMSMGERLRQELVFTKIELKPDIRPNLSRDSLPK